ncbi:PhzF family phenazine biosynthesis protein [Pleurocapsa sp. PCC 7319]|uniref:PhzF family phenazine biosynthesis protein n=1 Tax=Pleurocapsa sp. PCC 7319 TaxID=118161 RepID=UPI00034617A5|nr:PhzF family phenazine biosynthesis protein [Pleurocapsa sp. PCC 7319]
MKEIKVLHLDAFTKIKDKGNPAGVVLFKDELKEEEMQLIAKKVGFNETVFIEKCIDADYRFRYFTPEHEMNLCGHATIAGVYALYQYNDLKENLAIEIKTNIGIIKAKAISKDRDCIVEMEQEPPKFLMFEGEVEKLASVLNIAPENLIDNEIIYGNTGTWTLLVPVKSGKDLETMMPQTNNFPEVLTQIPKTSIHPYTLQYFDQNNLVVARHFSSPHSGTIEDPVTGTASGVIAAYLLKKYRKNKIEIDVLQGREMGKDGNLKAYAWKHGEKIEIKITGACVYNQEMRVNI